MCIYDSDACLDKHCVQTILNVFTAAQYSRHQRLTVSCVSFFSVVSHLQQHWHTTPSVYRLLPIRLHLTRTDHPFCVHGTVMFPDFPDSYNVCYARHHAWPQDSQYYPLHIATLSCITDCSCSTAFDKTHTNACTYLRECLLVSLVRHSAVPLQQVLRRFARNQTNTIAHITDITQVYRDHTTSDTL